MTVVVADTGIYVSALVFGGVPQAALIQMLDPPFRVAVPDEIKAELTETLRAHALRWRARPNASMSSKAWMSAWVSSVTFFEAFPFPVPVPSAF